MNLKELTTDELLLLVKEINDAEILQYVAEDTKLREYMNTLNPTIALIQAPIDIWKEVTERWKNQQVDLKLSEGWSYLNNANGTWDIKKSWNHDENSRIHNA